ncbi:Glycosyl transferase family 1 [Flavobacterium sp. 9AF]|uniref:glycosyltransferase family 4 protein n=1 Tax=Flavobacterium sp. 9AF TaxID=2653142 RepID=UPI0012F05F74|nr:glycosyltransferase family 1 protein [Flavobacterium sp. 9AF]VXC12934.1 Glycosyl transferase family 1 [Flavobacterium sp. 9AF]
MNVFLESHNINNKAGGLGTFNYQLINAFSKLDISDLDITLNAKHPEKLRKEFGKTFHYAKYSSLERYPLFRKKTKYDVWHSLNQNTKVEPFFKPKKYILTIHDVNFVEEIASDMHHEVNKRFIEKINRADVITYISEFAKQQTHQYFSVKGKPEHIIYNGNPSEILIKDIAFTPSNHPVNKPFFFSIGDFIPRKNFLSLVQMMEKIEDYNLILAGNNDKEYGYEILNYIKKANLGNKIFLVGKISDAAKQYYLQHCTAFLFPSIREGFGLPPIEAMKFSKPVFLSTLTSLPEIGGDAAFYWENFDSEYMRDFLFSKLEIFEKNKDFFIEKIKARADFFTWEKAAKAYLNLYKE